MLGGKSLAWLSFLLITANLHADSWRVFFYMDATDSLTDMAFKNMTDMLRTNPKDQVEFLIQLHAYGQSGLRYKVTRHGLRFVEEVVLSGNVQQDLEAGAQWGFGDCEADHTMLILSNHGWGILDPVWNEETKEWGVGADSLNHSCSLKSSPVNMTALKHHKRFHKGYMFSTDPRTYLSNQAMIDAMANIQANVLGGNKLDVIAFDTCMGAMLEVGYELAPYVNYLLGVQSCALLDGFDYQNLMTILNSQQNDPVTLLQNAVQGFDDYYAANDEKGIYTFSAIDLSQLDNVRQALDQVVSEITTLPEIGLLLDQARQSTHRFCMWPMYADPVNFCQELEQLFKDLSLDLPLSLQVALNDFYTTVQQAIIARCGGETTVNKAHGFAAYLPSGNTVDESYLQTPFAQESRWIELLKLAVGNIG